MTRFPFGSVRVPPCSSGDRLRSLHGQLRAAILEGRLQSGVRLPSTRAFAAVHGVSRNTAMAAYELLLSEGYLATRQGAGTYVADAFRTCPHAGRFANAPRRMTVG